MPPAAAREEQDMETITNLIKDTPIPKMVKVRQNFDKTCIPESDIPGIITRGLAKAGRTANFATVLPDQPKTLATLLNIVSDMGVNVLEVNHERGNLKAPVGSCVVHLLVETRDAAHVQEMYEALRAQGYPIMER